MNTFREKLEIIIGGIHSDEYDDLDEALNEICSLIEKEVIQEDEDVKKALVEGKIRERIRDIIISHNVLRGVQREIVRGTEEKTTTDDTDMIFYAFRYALGRHTSVVCQVIDYILNHWDEIPTKDKEQMKNEIRDYRYGDLDQTTEWTRILDKNI